MEQLEKKLSDLEVLSRGYWGNIYLISDKLILKTSPKYTREMIESEFARARAVFDAGIPCVEPVKMLDTEEGLAIVYERIEGNSIARRASKHLESLDTYLDAHVKLCRKIWSDNIQVSGIPSLKAEYLHIRDGLLKIADPEIVERFFEFMNALPDYHRFLHLDLHWCNVMYNNGECKLIDMPYVAVGHPAFDIGSVAFAYHLMPEYYAEDNFRAIFRITREEAVYSWTGFCERFFEGVPAEVAAERKSLAERLGKLIFVKNYMQDVLLGVDTEDDTNSLREYLTSFVKEDMVFADRVLREWEV